MSVEQAMLMSEIFFFSSALHSGRISVRWVTQLSKIAVTQFQDQTHSQWEKGFWAEGTREISGKTPSSFYFKSKKNKRTTRKRKTQTKTEKKKEKRVLMNKDFRIFGYTLWISGGKKKKPSALTQRLFSSALGTGTKVCVFGRRWRRKRVSLMCFFYVFYEWKWVETATQERLTEPFLSYANHAVYCFLSRHDRGLFLPCAGAMSKVDKAKSFYLFICDLFVFSLDVFLFTFWHNNTHTHGCLDHVCCFSCHGAIIKLQNKKKKTLIGLYFFLFFARMNSFSFL